MSKNAQIAKKWIDDNIVLAEHCDIEYSDLYKKLELLLDSQNASKENECVVLTHHENGAVSGRGKTTF